MHKQYMNQWKMLRPIQKQTMNVWKLKCPRQGQSPLVPLVESTTMLDVLSTGVGVLRVWKVEEQNGKIELNMIMKKRQTK